MRAVPPRIAHRSKDYFMSSPFSFSRVSGVIAALGLACVVLVFAAQAVPGDSARQAAPAGRIVLSVAENGRGELPPVPFDHEIHAKAVTTGNKDCTTCHQPPATPEKDADQGIGKGALSYKFKNTGRQNDKNQQDLYHDGCISCHTQTDKSGKRSGPLEAECRSCHVPPAIPDPAGKVFDPVLDKGLHARHIASADIAAPGAKPGAVGAANCMACHHSTPGDPTGANTRESCRSCHDPFRQVAHDSCITCHLKASKAKKPSGPADCAGCHDAATWSKYSRPAQVPPLPAGQPVTRLLSPVPSPETGKKDPAEKASMPLVPFNHKLHEDALPTCRSCHHSTLKSCSSCHTLGGVPQGGGVTLAQAMHKVDASYSCVGCHEQRKTATPQCMGCHTPKPAAMVKQDCAFCHKAPTSSSRQPKALPPGTAEMPPVTAAPPATVTPPSETVAPPETVIIGSLSQEYEPNILPHGAIIRALEKGIANATPSLSAMHAANYTACQACHHKSPASATPPKCASCHERSAPPAGAAPLPADGRPVLKAAYHQQCMGCHDRMAVKKPANADCESCHTKRIVNK